MIEVGMEQVEASEAIGTARNEAEGEEGEDEGAETFDSSSTGLQLVASRVKSRMHGGISDATT